MDLKKFFKKYDIDYMNNIFIICVSTGVDSMCLLHKFLQLKLNIIVAHVNHKMRLESESEEEYLISFCLNNNIIIEVKHLDIKYNENFQENARNFRYKFFNMLLEKYKTPYLVLAHHMDDDIETMILKLNRKASIKALCGMSFIYEKNKNIILRPLLDEKKSDLVKYAITNNIKYFDDLSNNFLKYERNKIRLLLNDVEEKYNTYKEIKLGLICISEFIETSIKLMIKDSIVEDRKIVFSSCVLKSKLLDEFLFELLKEYELSYEDMNKLINILLSPKYGKFKFNKLFIIYKQYDKIIIIKDINYKFEVRMNIDKCGEYVIDDNLLIRVRIMKNSNEFLTNLCYNNMLLPIVIRSRCESDKILLPYGNKSVKKLLIDRKISAYEKERVLIGEKDNVILGVLGLVNSKHVYDVEKNIVIEVINGRNY